MREHIIKVTVIKKHNHGCDCHKAMNVVRSVDCSEIVITNDLDNMCVIYIIVNNITPIEYDNRLVHDIYHRRVV